MFLFFMGADAAAIYSLHVPVNSHSLAMSHVASWLRSEHTWAAGSVFFNFKLLEDSDT